MRVRMAAQSLLSRCAKRGDIGTTLAVRGQRTVRFVRQHGVMAFGYYDGSV